LLAVFELVLFVIVPRDLPVLYYALYAIQYGAFHYNARFVITLILLSPQNERYNEVTAYLHKDRSFAAGSARQ